MVCLRVGGARSGWWYALQRSMCDEPGEPIKIQTNPISFFCSGFWGLEKLNHCPAVLVYIDLVFFHHHRIFPWLLHLKINQLVQRDDKCESHGANWVSTAPEPFKYLLGCMFFIDTPQKVNTLVLEPSTCLSSSILTSQELKCLATLSPTSLEYDESKVYEDFFRLGKYVLEYYNYRYHGCPKFPLVGWWI